MHPVLPPYAYVPAWHWAHPPDAAPAEKDPGAHAWHTEAGAAAYRPAPHAWQVAFDTCAVRLLAVPFGHAWHALEFTGDHVPPGHSEHVNTAPVRLYAYPARQMHPDSADPAGESEFAGQPGH